MTDDVLHRIAQRDARVAVIGQGYVGLVVAMRASEAGFPVVGLETDHERVAALQSGQSYIEDVSDEILRAALDRGYAATADPADLAGYDVAVISVPTPLREGAPDLSHIEAAAHALAPHTRAGCLVVLESTTYPGTTREVVGPLLAAGSPEHVIPGEDLLLGYSPERIDPGNDTWSLHNTPKVVSGIDERSREAVEAFFSTFVEETVAVSSCEAAELSKVLENTFRHVNIALVNELAKFANDLGVNVFEAIAAADTKPFGFMRFTPGPGVGGHCLPIDPTYLSWRVKRRAGESFRFVELANDINESMPRYVVRRVTAALNRHRKAVNGARIVVLGLAYKPGVGDARETPSLPLITQLVDLGGDVVVVDPHVDPAAVTLPDGVELVATTEGGLLDSADLAVIVTDHDDFDYDRLVATAPLILDTRDRLAAVDADHVERL